MVISRRRFVENLKEMHGIKKKHVKGVQKFCFRQLSMQIFWRRRRSRVVDLKLPVIANTKTHGTLQELFFLPRVKAVTEHASLPPFVIKKK